jgi:acyl carrier protein
MILHNQSTDPDSAMPDIDPNNARLASLPQPILDAYLQFQSDGDPASFRLVLHHVMQDFRPDSGELAVEDLNDRVRLVEDLGYSSLTLTEMVFYFEDLFGVAITNAQLRELITIGDLRRFVIEKLRSP